MQKNFSATTTRAAFILLLLVSGFCWVRIQTPLFLSHPNQTVHDDNCVKNNTQVHVLLLNNKTNF